MCLSPILLIYTVDTLCALVTAPLIRFLTFIGIHNNYGGLASIARR